MPQRTSGSSSMAEVIFLPPLLNPEVAKYYAIRPATGDDWFARSEIPSSKEILERLPLNDEGLQDTGLVKNSTRRAWSSKEAYLKAHYTFLREEAVRPLREAVSKMINIPSADEESFHEIGIYEKARIIGFTTSSRGVALKVSFSTRRAGKKINWKQSKRLLSGSLVVLQDQAADKVIVATVAARSLEGVEKNPPEIDIFVGAEELEIDPAVDWLLIEAKGGLYEAERHTLTALQRMMHESFPLQRHLVNLDPDIDPPPYLKASLDLSGVFNDDSYKDVDPQQEMRTTSLLDSSQTAAVQRMLTKSLAIIQGPPGTGKTFVSVQTIKAMLANTSDDDPPIVVTCQTNHALDQLLRHLAEFETTFARLGGRSKDRGIIKERTLYALREAQVKLPGCKAPGARMVMQQLSKAISLLMMPLRYNRDDSVPLDPEILAKHNIISEQQATLLAAGANKWIQTELRNPAEARSPFHLWLGHGLIKVPYKPLLDDFGFEFEEAELEFEELQEIEAENSKEEDEDFKDALLGAFFTLADSYMSSNAYRLEDKVIEKLLVEQDLWKIAEGQRGPMYAYMQRKLKGKLVKQFRTMAAAYNKAVHEYRVGLLEKDELILRQQKVIGLTTTGLSKYRGLISALGCRVILVEEAAETLEAPLIAACVPSLQHLLLVGDHKQLRPQCRVKDHEALRYNISLFERLVNNQLGMTTLTTQRRMRPEIRRILRPIYNNLITDHASVLHKPDVAGMNGINSYWFSHTEEEHRDDQMSCINEGEASMIVGFYVHLIHNGYQPEDITVLTFYNGQRKTLLRQLHRSAALAAAFQVSTDALKPRRNFNVVTVDSYQGEENKIVLLSLVRNNKVGKIGFLDVQNRVCVALSRAQIGLYIFGNALLFDSYKKVSKKDHPGANTWRHVIQIMAGADAEHPEEVPSMEPSRIHTKLPITCMNHGNTVHIEVPTDWDGLYGGCRLPCGRMLPCSHRCAITCHPSQHHDCRAACSRILACGHNCSVQCGQTCSCNICKVQKPPLRDTSLGRASHTSRSSSVQSWRDFAQEESKRYAQAGAWTASPGGSPLKHGTRLVEVDENDTTKETMKTSGMNRKKQNNIEDKKKPSGPLIGDLIVFD